MENTCLRPACFGDFYANQDWNQGGNDRDRKEALWALNDLYTAEWQKRGFKRSP